MFSIARLASTIGVILATAAMTIGSSFHHPAAAPELPVAAAPQANVHA